MAVFALKSSLLQTNKTRDSTNFNKRNLRRLLKVVFDLFSLTGVEIVPEDSYFVLGDNRVRSRDSRIFGFVPQADIAGKAAMVYFPFEDFGFIEN